MKILALNGSPRKGGNTDILLDEVIRGAETKGHVAQKVYLYDYEIRPCMDCRACKKGDLVCVLKDGMGPLYPLLSEADLIVFGTPIYWYGPTAKMKLMIDRLRPYIANGGLKGKKGAIVVPSEEGEACCGPTVEMFRMSFSYLGMEYVGEILARAYERGEIKGKPAELKRAFDLGASWGGVRS